MAEPRAVGPNYFRIIFTIFLFCISDLFLTVLTLSSVRLRFFDVVSFRFFCCKSRQWLSNCFIFWWTADIFLLGGTVYILDITCLEIDISWILSKYGDSVMKISLVILLTNGFENVKRTNETERITSVVFSNKIKTMIATNNSKKVHPFTVFECDI